MSRFLSHDQTKVDLTEYQAKKTLDHSSDSTQIVITSAGDHTRSNKNVGIVSREQSRRSRHPDDLLGGYLQPRGTQRPEMWKWHSSPRSTHVLVLLIANYHMLPKKTSISMASGVLYIEPIWKALGPEKAKALSAFHAFTRAVNTGIFTRIGKQTWFKLFLEAENEIIKALGMLSDDTDVTEESLQSHLASFVCFAYCSKGIEISDPSHCSALAPILQIYSRK